MSGHRHRTGTFETEPSFLLYYYHLTYFCFYDHKTSVQLLLSSCKCLIISVRLPLLFYKCLIIIVILLLSVFFIIIYKCLLLINILQVLGYHYLRSVCLSLSSVRKSRFLRNRTYIDLRPVCKFEFVCLVSIFLGLILAV